jgi:hypothetical protein
MKFNQSFKLIFNFPLKLIKCGKALELEGKQTKYLVNRFCFIDEDLFEIIEKDFEILKLNIIHNPIRIDVFGMFSLNYFILYAVRTPQLKIISNHQAN